MGFPEAVEQHLFYPDEACYRCELPFYYQVVDDDVDDYEDVILDDHDNPYHIECYGYNIQLKLPEYLGV